MQKRSRAVNEALLLEALGFIFVALLIWVNEYLDVSHRVFGSPATPFRPVEVAIESGFVLLLGAAVTGVSWLTFRRLAYLESLLLLFITVLGVLRQAILRIQRLSHMLTMCAWCRKVLVNGEWISIDQFLQQRRNTTSSVGLCPDCYGQQAAANPASKLSRSA